MSYTYSSNASTVLAFMLESGLKCVVRLRVTFCVLFDKSLLSNNIVSNNFSRVMDCEKNASLTPMWIRPDPPVEEGCFKYRCIYLKSPTSPRKFQSNQDFCLSCTGDLNFSSAMRRKLSSKRQSGDRDYIGFATLPEQVHRKSVKRGFDFTLMVVGESGLGKSTLINSLFLSDLYKDRKIFDVQERVNKTTSIERKTMDIEERGVKLRLTVVDTPGFGDSLNCEDSWRVCCNYIDEQFRQYFTDESGLNRKNIVDNRVHCCLYFIPPYGHGLRQLDIELMKQIQHKVNIVPVIGKADTLTEPEMKRLKRRIMSDIQENNIQIYQFPECDSDEDEDFKRQDKELKECIPFAVIGSHNIIEVGGKKVRGRQYPWGIVEVENPKHSDFNKLRNMLITTHMQDLKEVTEDVYYENFRVQCISQISQQAIKERGKLKRESVSQMDGIISDTDKLLLQKDEEIRRMQNMLSQMQEKLKATSRSSNSIYSDSQTPTRDSVINV